MKKERNFAQAIMMVLCMVCGVIFAACSATFSEDIVPDEEKDTTTTPTPDPDEPTPDPIPGFLWGTCMTQDVAFNEATDSVTATNTWQVTENGDVNFIDVAMRYLYEVNFTAPSRVVVESQDSTHYAGQQGRWDERMVGDYRREGSDSLWTIQSFMDGGYQTQYYTLGLNTVRQEGIDLRGGKETPYLRIKEFPSITSIWHEPMMEVEVNDSVFNREVVHNCLKITLQGKGPQTWTLRREKVVVVDHFIKIKEEEKPEPEKVKADFWANNLKGFISCTKVWRDDTQSWSDAYLFECKDTYEIILANYIVTHKDNKDVETLTSVERKSVSKSVCPASGEYNGVIQVGGNFYPGRIDVDSSGWSIITPVNGGMTQTHADQFANNSGIKNQNKNNNAKPSPFITTTKVENKVNGKLVIKVTAKTLTHTGVYTMADASLK